MLASEAARLIGKEATIYANGLTVAVRITEIKQAYGRTRYQVTPIAGTGTVWVESVTI